MIAEQINEEMVEAAAMALRAVVAARSGFTRGFGAPRPWHALPEGLKASYRREASAMLSAALAVAAIETRARA